MHEVILPPTTGDALIPAPQIDLVDSFLTRDPNASPNTVKAYKTDLRQFFGNELVDRYVIRQFDPLDIRGWVQQWERPRTVRRKLAVVHAFYEYCIQLQLIGHNPAAKWLVKRPPLPNEEEEIKGLSKKEYEHLRYVARQHQKNGLRNDALIVLGVSAALRVGELLEIRVGEVKRVQGRPSVRLRKRKAKSGQVDQRISEEAYELVQDYIRAFDLPKGSKLWRITDDEQPAGGRPGRDGATNFRPYLEPITYWDAYRLIRELVQDAGFDPFFAHPHVLRHTFGVIAAMCGENPEDVRQHMGHKSLDTTLIYYKAQKRFTSTLVDNLFS